MSITRTARGDKYQFRFDRMVPGHGRVLRCQALPADWGRPEADAFDVAETARLFAELAGAQQQRDPAISEAVALYLNDKPSDKARRAVAAPLAAIAWAFEGKCFSALADVADDVVRHGREVGLSPATLMLRLAVLKAAARHAWKAHRLTSTDPTTRMALPTLRF